jgi:hypothetical protein
MNIRNRTNQDSSLPTASWCTPGLVPVGVMAAMLCALGSGCSSLPPPADLDLGTARIVGMATSPAVDVSGLPGGKAMGVAVGAGAGSGYGALAGGAACLAAGPLFPICLAMVLPTTTAIGAVSGAVIGGKRTESVDAIEAKTRALRDEMAATPYNDLLAHQLQARLLDKPAASTSPVAQGVEVETDSPWTLEVGVTEVGTEGKSEFALRLVATLRLRRAGTAVLWQTAREVQSDTELTIDRWLADDSMALHAVLNRCIERAARQLEIDVTRPVPDKPGNGRSAGKHSSSCGDVVAPLVQASGA